MTLDATQRPGFMTRAGFLSTYSHTTRPRPILRGAFITILMLGVNPGAPDPGFDDDPAACGHYTTHREIDRRADQ